MILGRFFAAVAAIYAISMVFHPALRLRLRWRIVTGGLVASLLALTPWMVPVYSPVARLALGMFAGISILKLWDLHLGAERGVRPDFREMLVFMAIPTSLVHRRKELLPRSRGWREAHRMGWALVVIAGSWVALTFLAGRDWSGTPVLVEHAAKATTFMVLAVGVFEVLAVSARLLGGSSIDPIDRPWTARTPAEFWRRYNQTVSEFMREDVFRTVGGRRHPVRAVLIAFLVSGVLHEYIFWVASGEIHGYQTTFFLLQGCAVALTLRARPPRLLGIAGTLAFNVTSSVLFFASLHETASFYSRGIPSWLWGP